MTGRWRTGRWMSKSHWCWDNIKCFCSLAFFCYMFKVDVFIVPVSVHGPEFKRSECMYLIS